MPSQAIIEDVFAVNPLSKVPLLNTDQGDSIFDSWVICNYMDRYNSGAKLIPVEGRANIESLRLEALSNGLSEVGILVRWENTRRPEHLRYKSLLDGQLSKLAAGYDYLETHVTLSDQATIGEIALATSLSWLEFRQLPTFRNSHPKLSAWYDTFSARKSMKATTLVGNTYD